MSRAFEEIPPVSREEGLRLIESADGPTRARAVLALALHDSDWLWTQNLSLSLFDDPDAGVRGAAALALGHIARIHRQLELEKVLPALLRLRDDVAAGWRAQDALDDIDTFLKVRPQERQSDRDSQH